MRAALALLFPVGLLAVVGCSANVASSANANDAQALSPATAIVVVERTEASATEPARADAVARFVRARSGVVDERALEMVGASVDVPAIDSCSDLPIAQDATTEPAHAVELADVGDMTIEIAGAKTNLLPRQQPDVADLLSGVVYAARAGDGSALPASAKYTVHAGSVTSDIAPFFFDASAPSEIEGLRIDGEDAHADVTLVEAAPVDVAWTAGDADDLVYVDIASGSAATASARCLFSDVGHGTIPAATFASIDLGTLKVHRLHREAFHAAGIDAGEIRFDFSRVVSFRH
jgi:hypothetical protein